MDRPIVCTSEEVTAIIEGRKTMMRRPMEPQPLNLSEGSYCDPYNGDEDHFTFWTADNRVQNQVGSEKDTCHWKCPIGKTGDRLLVKEVWAARGAHTDGIPDTEIDANGSHFSIWTYGQCYHNGQPQFNLNFFGRWRSAESMPDWASRLTLEVTGVKVEQLQSITVDDVVREGACRPFSSPARCLISVDIDYRTWEKNAVVQFEKDWNIRNAKRGHSFDTNPWVWVVSFKKV